MRDSPAIRPFRENVLQTRHHDVAQEIMSEFHKIEDLIAQFAANAVITQEIWNDAHQRELDEFCRLLSLDPASAGWLQSLVPSRMAAHEFSISAALELGIDNSSEFNVTCKPLNVQYLRRFTRSTRSSSQLRIVVEQCPAAMTTNASLPNQGDNRG